jgi:O-methyltransferase
MIKKAIKFFVRKIGYDIVKYNDVRKLPPDFERQYIEIIERVSPYTITSPERIYTLIQSVQYILRSEVKGDFLECGVYKGGSMMTIALTLMAEGVTDRDLYLFDTFDMVPVPDARDINIYGKPALEWFSENNCFEVSLKSVNASVVNVKQNMAMTGYPMERMHFIEGLVENTIPEKAPKSVALLRLDTDWYQSTIHELTNLYPNVTPKGIVIVDDYGYYTGAREAVDEYFQKNNMMPFLHRIDDTGRLIIKDE